MKRKICLFLFLFFFYLKSKGQTVLIDDKNFDKHQVKLIKHAIHKLSDHFDNKDCSIIILPNKYYNKYLGFYYNDSPNHYIFLSKNLNKKKLLYVIIHEYIHLMQAHNKDAIYKDYNLVYWKDEKINKRLEYAEREWEIEAFNKTPKLYKHLFKNES